MKIGPSRDLRPFVNYYLRLLSWSVLLGLSSSCSMAVALYCFFDISNAVLTTFFLFNAWWLMRRCVRPLINSIIGLKILSVPRADILQLEQIILAIGIAYGAGETIPFNPYAMRTLDVYESLLRQTNRESEIEDMRLRVKQIALVADN